MGGATRAGAFRRTPFVQVGAALIWVYACIAGTELSAQSLLDRSPNIGGTWVGNPWVFHFHFMHRFDATEAPTRKVLNSPGFLLGLSLPAQTLIGARYATNSVLVAGYPNEWEFFGRFRPVSQTGGGPLDLALHGGYNQGAKSWDGELTASRELGLLRLNGALRGFSAFRGNDARWAAAGGASVRVHQFIALGGDVGTLFDRTDDEDIAWSAGVQLAIPYTPHTLSLHVANTHTTSLQGSSLGLAEGKRWGFEFTIPITPSRYFGTSSADSTVGVTDPNATFAADIGMTNQLRFQPAAVRIRTGQTVRWRNTSEMPHTVTANPARASNPQNARVPAGAQPFDSGNMAPGATFTHTFTVPGEYVYFCIPHEGAAMVGRVTVE